MAGPRDEHGVQVALSDRSIGVGVHQVESWHSAEVAEQPSLDVVGLEWFSKQRIGRQVDLPDR
jgi:hypothetical protein